MQSRGGSIYKKEASKNITKLFNLLEKKKKIGIVCHTSADPDSYLSAYSLQKLLDKIGKYSEVIVISNDKIVERLKRSYKARFSRGSYYDIYVAVDVGELGLIGEWKYKAEGKVCLIDHHYHEDLENYSAYLLEDKTSTAELVLELYSFLGVRIGRKVAQALLDAILFDTSNLVNANEETISACYSLIRYGASIKVAREEIRREREYGEKVARLKGARRMRILKADNWLIVTTNVNSYQAEVSRALVNLGADLAIAYSTKKEFRLSMRSSETFYSKTGIHLGRDLATPVSAECSCSGGGHARAAAINSFSDPIEVSERCLNRLEKLLNHVLVELKD